MEPNPHLSAYPLAGCSRTTRMRFPTDTVEVGIDGAFVRGGPFACDRSSAVFVVPERRTSTFGAVFSERPRRRRSGRLRALILHSGPHAFKAGTCMTRLGCASLLRSTSLRSRCSPRPCSNPSRSSSVFSIAWLQISILRPRIAGVSLPVRHQDDRIGSKSVVPQDVRHRPTRNILAYNQYAFSMACLQCPEHFAHGAPSSSLPPSKPQP